MNITCEKNIMDIICEDIFDSVKAPEGWQIIPCYRTAIMVNST